MGLKITDQKDDGDVIAHQPEGDEFYVTADGRVYQYYKATPTAPKDTKVGKVGEQSGVVNPRLAEMKKQGPPGPPPHPGLVWNSDTHRWRASTSTARSHSRNVYESNDELKARAAELRTSIKTTQNQEKFMPTKPTESGTVHYRKALRAVKAEQDRRRKGGERYDLQQKAVDKILRPPVDDDVLQTEQDVAQEDDAQRRFDEGPSGDTYESEPSVGGRHGVGSGTMGKTLADLDLILKQGGPPGPPPRSGLEWNPSTHIWRHPESEEEQYAPEERSRTHTV